MYRPAIPEVVEAVRRMQQRCQELGVSLPVAALAFVLTEPLVDVVDRRTGAAAGGVLERARLRAGRDARTAGVHPRGGPHRPTLIGGPDFKPIAGGATLVRTNAVKDKLRGGGTAVGTMVFEFFVPGLPRLHGARRRRIRDLRHGARWRRRSKRCACWPRRRAVHRRCHSRACRRREYHLMAGALDAGMLGLMIPMVEDGAQARTIVNPRAIRRSAAAAPVSAWPRTTTSVAAPPTRSKRSTRARSSSRRSNRPSGLDNLDEIAGDDGIDCLWVGHNDLSIQMGIPGQFQSPALPGCDQTRGRRGGPPRLTSGCDGRRPGRARRNGCARAIVPSHSARTSDCSSTGSRLAFRVCESWRDA